ncbi:hypothetical protein COCMIDRAFT_3110 [Bipolaris oryzae ATCC 44560]|uniref:Uncharacterized protein n=1 Tax=Bipolaris oryzae ATCC 44560 TaxID=930090 RepID=W6ZDM5_COCMI|nr:uncharacterized protein COCMIDRAFT_3110 [Bipolaris oryzae ATCC 44560]EUC47978.1 hypothetical protein COCMIDRAFT_3110 [Bipolaris oryzae ATCC 44560]
MAAQTVHEDVTYPATLRTDDDGDISVVVVQPITYYQLATPAASRTPVLTAPITAPSKPRHAASDLLTSDNLAMQDNGFDPILDVAQKAAKALGLQRAGNELGFHLELQHYTNDRFDLNGWTTQQAR